MITDEGTIYFGHRTEAGDGVRRGTGDRHRLRYRVRNGQIEFSLDDRRDIGDELCRAYADGGLEQQLVDAQTELEAVLIACRRLEGDVMRLREELASAKRVDSTGDPAAPLSDHDEARRAWHAREHQDCEHRQRQAERSHGRTGGEVDEERPTLELVNRNK